MDLFDKVDKYIKYKNIELPDLDETINDTFLLKSNKLKNNKFKNFELNLQNIIEIIDEITTINDITKLNILYDNILDKIKILCDGEWKLLLIEFGIKDKIQTYYLDSYECYLIRKIKNENILKTKIELQERLYEYYKFLAWFNIEPYIYKKNNNKILFNNNDSEFDKYIDDFSIYDEYYDIYRKIISKINKTEQNKVKKGIENIIKKNTKSFIIELNKNILESFKNDEEFKNEFINNILYLA
jgi:hypothetical protein